MTLRDLATYPAVTCAPATSVADAARLMADENIGFLAVVADDGKPVGVLTDRDIVIRVVAWGRDRAATVGEVMTQHPVCVREQGAVADAARLMADRLCRRLVVTDEAGRIVGILSLDDLLRVAGTELAEIARTVRGTHGSYVYMDPDE